MLETILIFGIPIVAIVCLFTCWIVKTLSDNALKRRMVDQGMTAEEIIQVIKAKSK
jgi:hypothetical protein